MSKMNRRDYLKTMGAGIGSLIAMDNLSVLAGQQKRKRGRTRKQPRTLTTSTTLLWPPTPDEPNVSSFCNVFFWGLIGFAYNRDHHGMPVCEVGFHPGAGHHKQKFTLYKIKNGQNIDTTSLSIKKEMSLKLATNPRGPKFFEPETPPFNRLTGHPKDFRWLPDLHGSRTPIRTTSTFTTARFIPAG
jgi:hypothetical protein